MNGTAPALGQQSTGLTTGYYVPTDAFKAIPEHVAVMREEDGGLVAVCGPVGDAESEALARQFAASTAMRTALSEINDRLCGARAHRCVGWDCAICGPMAASQLQGLISEVLEKLESNADEHWNCANCGHEYNHGACCSTCKIVGPPAFAERNEVADGKRWYVLADGDEEYEVRRMSVEEAQQANDDAERATDGTYSWCMVEDRQVPGAWATVATRKW